MLDNGVLTVAIPSLTEDLGASAQDIQWIIASYILVFAGLLLTAGSLSDRYGRKRVMIVGLAVFGAASLLATFANSPETLIAGRVLMGIGGALVMPSTLSILITVFDDAERRKAMSIWSSVLMVGLIGGPPLDRGRTRCGGEHRRRRSRPVRQGRLRRGHVEQLRHRRGRGARLRSTGLRPSSRPQA